MPRPSKPNVALGRAIRALRAERGQSQEALASEAGIDVTYLRGIELGKRNPSWTVAAGIADALDMSLSELAAHAEREESSPG